MGETLLQATTGAQNLNMLEDEKVKGYIPSLT